jgi:hypothetical protein
MDEPIFTETFDIADARPRQPEEPGEHTFSQWIRVPHEYGVEPMEIRWYRDRSFSLHRRGGERIEPTAFFRDESGDSCFVFEEEE